MKLTIIVVETTYYPVVRKKFNLTSKFDWKGKAKSSNQKPQAKPSWTCRQNPIKLINQP